MSCLERNNGKKYDLIIAFECIYYFEEPEKFLKNSHRALEPGGTLLISSVNPSWDSFNPSPHHTKYFTKKEFQRMLQQAGFNVTSAYCYKDESVGVLNKCKKFLKGMAIRFNSFPKRWLKTFLKDCFR